jgi:chorismate-pyruvate lyase
MLHIYYHDRDPRRAGGPGDVFRAKGFADGYCIDRLDRPALAMDSLPPILRSLLVTDGTVTKTLEAYFWEPVRVAGLKQRVVQAEAPIAWLDVPVGGPVLARHVALRGAHSGRHFANAFSVIRLDVIPATLRARLLDGDIGIGDVIRSCGLESYRELLELATTDDFALGGGTGEPRQDCVRRTYRITFGGRSSLLVTECFALKAFVARA